MKHKAKRKQSPVFIMKLMPRDEKVLANLLAKNRTLGKSEIVRLALDQLAEKQGVLPEMAEVS